jgi:hypothetical protein
MIHVAQRGTTKTNGLEKMTSKQHIPQQGVPGPCCPMLILTSTICLCFLRASFFVGNVLCPLERDPMLQHHFKLEYRQKARARS